MIEIVDGIVNGIGEVDNIVDGIGEVDEIVDGSTVVVLFLRTEDFIIIVSGLDPIVGL